MSTRTVTCVASPTPEQAEALRETMRAFNAACNTISAVAWEEQLFDARSLHSRVYYRIRAEFQLPAQLVCRALAKVADAYKTSKERQATFREMGAVVYDRRVLRLVNLSTVSVATLQGRIKLSLKVGGYQRHRLAHATLGETDLLYHPDRKRFSFAFTVKEATPPESEPEEFLGVDLGIKNIAADSDGRLHAGGKLRHYRKRCRRLRGRLQKLGTRGSRRRLVKRRRKERRHATHVNHGISKQLVSLAQGTGRGIAVEDLSHIHDRITVRREQRAEHRGWAFHQLRAFLEYKCADAGIACVPVDARDTSRTCPRCRCVEKRNRPSQPHFRCIQCGLQGHADTFGAVEIARRAAVNRPNYPEWQPPGKRADVLQGKAVCFS